MDLSRVEGKWFGTVESEHVGSYIDTFVIVTFGGIPWQVKLLTHKINAFYYAVMYIFNKGILAKKTDFPSKEHTVYGPMQLSLVLECNYLFV